MLVVFAQVPIDNVLEHIYELRSIRLDECFLITLLLLQIANRMHPLHPKERTSLRIPFI